MARTPPFRCGCNDRGDSTAWDDSDVCPRQATTAEDHDDVAAEWKRVFILYRLHYREQRRGLLARHVEDCVRYASCRTDDGDVLWDPVNRRVRYAHSDTNQRVHRPGPGQRW